MSFAKVDRFQWTGPWARPLSLLLSIGKPNREYTNNILSAARRAGLGYFRTYEMLQKYQVHCAPNTERAIAPLSGALEAAGKILYPRHTAEIMGTIPVVCKADSGKVLFVLQLILAKAKERKYSPYNAYNLVMFTLNNCAQKDDAFLALNHMLDAGYALDRITNMLGKMKKFEAKSGSYLALSEVLDKVNRTSTDDQILKLVGESLKD